MEWLVSHQIVCPDYLMQSFLQTEQSESDQDHDDVKMAVPKISSNCFVKRSNIAEQKAVNGSANENLQSYLLSGERREVYVIQHNTNDSRIGEKPNTCHLAWPPPRMYTIERTATTAIRLKLL